MHIVIDFIKSFRHVYCKQTYITAMIRKVINKQSMRAAQLLLNLNCRSDVSKVVPYSSSIHTPKEFGQIGTYGDALKNFALTNVQGGPFSQRHNDD